MRVRGEAACRRAESEGSHVCMASKEAACRRVVEGEGGYGKSVGKRVWPCLQPRMVEGEGVYGKSVARKGGV